MLGPMWAGLTPDSKGDPTGDTEEPDRRRQETTMQRALRPQRDPEPDIRWHLYSIPIYSCACTSALFPLYIHIKYHIISSKYQRGTVLPQTCDARKHLMSPDGAFGGRSPLKELKHHGSKKCQKLGLSGLRAKARPINCFHI